MIQDLRFKNGILVFILILTTYFLLPTSTLAQLTEYKLLEPLPGITSDGAGTKTNANTYIAGLFNLTLALAVAFAVLRLIYAGITYMSSDAFGKKGAAKAIIEQTLWGLALAISAWVIVAAVIKPQEPGAFVFDLSLDAIPLPVNNNDPSGTTVGGKGVVPGYALTPEQVMQNNVIRQDLLNHNPSVVVNNGPCTTATRTTGCTNVVGLPPHAIASIKGIATACNCSITISGGTEGGHTDHGPGVAVVDLRPSSALNNYLAKTNPAAANPQNKTRVKIGGITYTYETLGANGRSTGIHWHVELQ